jgi:ketopantoate reductase
LAAGVKTENDHISGAVVAAGRRVAVPTPYNETMFRLIRAREAIGDISYNWRDTAAKADSLSERNP